MSCESLCCIHCALHSELQTSQGKKIMHFLWYMTRMGERCFFLYLQPISFFKALLFMMQTKIWEDPSLQLLFLLFKQSVISSHLSFSSSPYVLYILLLTSPDPPHSHIPSTSWPFRPIRLTSGQQSLRESVAFSSHLFHFVPSGHTRTRRRRRRKRRKTLLCLLQSSTNGWTQHLSLSCISFFYQERNKR